MADGSPPVTQRMVTRRRTMASYAEDADPRFSDKPPKNRARQEPKRDKKQPRIAFTGEEFGFGYQATEEMLQRARARGTVPDGGLRGLSTLGARTEREYDEASKNARFDYRAEIPQPLRTKEQALMAVKQGTADFAVIPFYQPYSGYDFESLRALSSLFTVLGVDQVEATDHLCLAVHESQLYDIIQSAHPGTGFSALQRRMRQSWGLTDNGSGNEPGGTYDAERPRAGLPIDMGDQKLIRDRIDVVFAGPEAARRAKSKLDGFRAIGVEVQETPEMVEPHRELARRARAAVNTTRQTNTMFDPTTGETRFFSTLGAESQTGKLFGMILPYEVAMRSSDYVIIDHNVDDAPPAKTRFMVVENNPDHTLFEDAYRTTDARTRYWNRRLSALSNGAESFVTGAQRFVGSAILVFALALMALGVMGYLSEPRTFLLEALGPWLTVSNSILIAVAGGLLALLAWLLLAAQRAGANGVRVMLRFRRDQTAASIGDVENFLRNYGIRHAVVRMDEDSEADTPASIVLDIEFEPKDFVHNPWTMLTRRLRGSVANGAMKKAFQRWKNRGVLVLAAMPFSEPQLPRHKQRRWWNEAITSWFADFTETMFIRLSRVLLLVIPAAAIFYVIWRMMNGG